MGLLSSVVGVTPAASAIRAHTRRSAGGILVARHPGARAGIIDDEATVRSLPRTTVAGKAASQR